MLNDNYWQNRYLKDDAGWDVGMPSTPIATYIDQLINKDLKILIPGCGNSYEAEYLWKNGFKNVHLLDYALQPISNFKKRVPSFPDTQLFVTDFFKHVGQYDLIIEQTFFCAINPSLRDQYAKHVHSLLADKGKLVGLLFNCEFEKDGPPFGGNADEYKKCFSPYFDFKTFETAFNSIAPRAGRELFINLQKRSLISQ